jgi:radical SAM protein with 4Fe4S-binding SPASM domain
MSSPIDDKAFAKLRRILPNQSDARRAPADWQARPLPEEISFKLTNRCDLRCSHCYQWGDNGYHRSLPRADVTQDLPLALIADVLEATRAIRSNVFLWGGEPLVYRHWAGLVDLLAGDERWTSLCTNGTLITQRLESLCRISRQLELSISIDGFQREHDALRGEGAFDRTMSGLGALVAARQAGAFRGEITVNCVIGDALCPRLCEMVAFLEAEGVETVYLSFPWYISPETAAKMDRYADAHLPAVAATVARRGGHARGSWHSFDFQLSPDLLPTLRAEIARIDRRRGPIKVRYNPALSEDEMATFLAGSDRPAQGKTRCLALRTRLDVFPNGEVVSCKFFPELAVGDLNQAPLEEVWHAAAYDHVRETVATCGLMPICAKCNLLYTRGA